MTWHGLSYRMIHEHEAGFAVLPPHLLGVVLHASLTQDRSYQWFVSASGSTWIRNDFALLTQDPDHGEINDKNE
jgi:hypothetical protein